MVLVDTNILIDYWKNPDEQIKEIFEKEDIAICGIVEAELLHGARSSKDIEILSGAISCFYNLSYSNNWRQLGRMLYKLRTSGITLPFTDVMIAQIAMEHKVSILSNDKHFTLLKGIFPELVIYR